jgi:bleomycin hydrolase
MDKKGRIISFESGSTHGMALMGVDTNHTGEPIKWLLENSWGPEKGYEGYLTMTNEWFDAFMFRIVVRKKFVSEKVLEVLKQKPIKLPPWDPMF